MTFNDIANRIAKELTKTYEEKFGDTSSALESYGPYGLTSPSSFMKEGYEKAMEVVRQTLCEIVSEEIKSKNLDFLL